MPKKKVAPKIARVFLVEDDLVYRSFAKRQLEEAGHTVVLEASNLPEALSRLDDFEKRQVSIAVLDANLTPGDRSGNDGDTIARAIRGRFPEVKILGFSLETYDWPDRMVDKETAMVMAEHRRINLLHINIEELL